jgi:hypothetical protein
LKAKRQQYFWQFMEMGEKVLWMVWFVFSRLWGEGIVIVTLHFDGAWH